MTPTSQLRFVERDIEIKSDDGFMTFHQTIRILQQWWHGETGDWLSATEFRLHGEWRDVPLEKEND
jgi:hypothetical protein